MRRRSATAVQHVFVKAPADPLTEWWPHSILFGHRNCGAAWHILEESLEQARSKASLASYLALREAAELLMIAYEKQAPGNPNYRCQCFQFATLGRFIVQYGGIPEILRQP